MPNGKVGVIQNTLYSKIEAPATVSIAGGWDYDVFITVDGSVNGCGENEYGQLGLGHAKYQYTSIPMNLPLPALKIVSGGEHTVILLCDGSVWGCGKSENGELGLVTTYGQTLLLQLSLPLPAIDIGAGVYHTTILLSDGSVWSCGDNHKGQLGTDKIFASIKPIQMMFDHDTVVAVSCESERTAILCGDGSVWTCGSYQRVPTKIDLPFKVKSVTCGQDVFIFITETGEAYRSERPRHLNQVALPSPAQSVIVSGDVNIYILEDGCLYIRDYRSSRPIPLLVPDF
jgi:alpha-tubulin suppressor-like RCC1 family protein